VCLARKFLLPLLSNELVEYFYDQKMKLERDADHMEAHLRQIEQEFHYHSQDISQLRASVSRLEDLLLFADRDELRVRPCDRLMVCRLISHVLPDHIVPGVKDLYENMVDFLDVMVAQLLKSETEKIPSRIAVAIQQNINQIMPSFLQNFIELEQRCRNDRILHGLLALLRTSSTLSDVLETMKQSMNKFGSFDLEMLWKLQRSRDYASLQDGARLLHSSHAFQRSRLNGPNQTYRGAEEAFLPSFQIGHCWLFSGSVGSATIVLSQTVVPREIVVEHRLSGADALITAPQEIEVWGLISSGMPSNFQSQ
jgi:hypothetical protein